MFVEIKKTETFRHNNLSILQMFCHLIHQVIKYAPGNHELLAVFAGFAFMFSFLLFYFCILFPAWQVAKAYRTISVSKNTIITIDLL